jgi:hypothetical protein
MLHPGDIISHTEMCMHEGISLQRGMNFKVNGGASIILMSVRAGAPYADRIEENGKILIYEGHDVPRNEAKVPKNVDQPMFTSSGLPTQNGKFFQAAQDFKNGKPPESVKVYQKIKKGIWTYDGIFELIDAWIEPSEGRNVFKFRLRITDKTESEKQQREKEVADMDHNRMIPTSVKLLVWKRDKGKCVECGSSDNLHFDHILPYSKGGTSLKAENIQLLCARHNLMKGGRIG